MAKRLPREHRLFNPDGRRFHRKTFSHAEVRWGLAVVGGLVAIAGWVAFKGANPDPELFASGVELLTDAKAMTPADRGPIPGALAAEGWSEGRLSRFDSDTLYEKINGRENYYKAFGFKQLYFISIGRDDDASAAVDIEIYDLTTSANALGAYAGELQPDANVELSSDGMSHVSRNSLFMTRGRHYLRAIGSDESAATKVQLAHLRKTLGEALKGEPIPWGHQLFAGQLGLEPGQVRYHAENAFSFEFGRGVFAAATGQGESELFAAVAADASAARELAAAFQKGFAQQGEPVTGGRWIRHRFLNEIAGVTSEGPWLIGVRAAADVATAQAQLARLQRALREAPPELLEQARQLEPKPSEATPAEADEDEGADEDGEGPSEGTTEDGYADEPASDGGQPPPPEEY